MNRREGLTKKEFWSTISEEVPRHFGYLDFSEKESGGFARERPGFWQAFGFTVNRLFDSFCVPVGLTVPALWPKVDFTMKGHFPALEISHRLGQFRKNMTGLDDWYSFSTVEELRVVIGKVQADFVEQAIPWLENFQTLEAVTAEYYRWRVGPPPSGEPRPPDPYAWAIYGWLLSEIGRVNDARPWLMRGYEEIRRPRFWKAGRFVPEGTKGAKPLPRRDEDLRLEELLRQSLKLPLE